MFEAINKIRHKFSQSAKTYDLFSSLHRTIADQLFLKITKEAHLSALLDVGCGTGYLTSKLKDHFHKSRIAGLDFSAQMLEVARAKHKDIDWVLGDVNNLPFESHTFNVVTSNLSYQWAEDLTKAFVEARRVLVPNGVFACTLFGFYTCQELFDSLGEATALEFPRLLPAFQVRTALVSSGFKAPQIDTEQIKIEFKDMYELMNWLKAIGANNLSTEGFLGPGALSRAALIYAKKFPYLQGVGATFEVIKIYAKS